MPPKRQASKSKAAAKATKTTKAGSTSKAAPKAATKATKTASKAVTKTTPEEGIATDFNDLIDKHMTYDSEDTTLSRKEEYQALKCDFQNLCAAKMIVEQRCAFYIDAMTKLHEEKKKAEVVEGEDSDREAADEDEEIEEPVVKKGKATATKAKAKAKAK